MNTLALRVEPSPDSNDHQVRIIIDGEDWLGGDHLGIDPPELFAQEALLRGGELLIGRCECGCVGCDDVTVEVARKGLAVVWEVREGVFLFFAAREYDRIVDKASKDVSWEDEKRTAERLVANVLAGTELTGGYTFDWASARTGSGKISVSFSKGRWQKIFDFGWDGEDPKSALPGAKRFKAEKIDQ